MNSQINRTEEMKYLIVVEKTETGFSAYSPDVPGCVSTGRTEEETEANMKEAIEFHVDGLKQEGLPVPGPSAKSAYVEINAQKIPLSPPLAKGEARHRRGIAGREPE